MLATGAFELDSTKDRRLIERLSGWRLIAFLVSAAVNLGFVIALIQLPLLLQKTASFFAVSCLIGSQCVFLMAVAGFRFPVSTKLVLGGAHTVACIAALNNLDMVAGLKLASTDLVYLVLPVVQCAVMTIGGIVFAWRLGFHTKQTFRIVDFLVLVSAFAVSYPLAIQSWPDVWLTEIPAEKYYSALWLAAVNACWGVVVLNLFLRVLTPGADRYVATGLVIGLFLLNAIIDWPSCQFGLMVASWIFVSLVPIYGLHAAED